MLVDLRVKIGLSECGLVTLIMPETAVTIHVDHDVAPEFLTKIERKLADLHAGEWIVAVHMKDRHLNHFGDVGGVHRRARVFRNGGETDLIVHDHVHRAASPVTVQLRHVQCFGDDPLPGESRVAMKQ